MTNIPHALQPAIKLLEYYRWVAVADDHATKLAKSQVVEAGGLPVLLTSKIQKYSATLRELESIGAEHARAWVNYWTKIGFLE